MESNGDDSGVTTSWVRISSYNNLDEHNADNKDDDNDNHDDDGGGNNDYGKNRKHVLDVAN